MTDHSILSAAAVGAGEGRSARVPHLVLPRLLTVPALSILILVGEFLALVLLFAGAEVSWTRFALLSLYVQWVALLSALALSLLNPALRKIGLGVGSMVAIGMVLGITFIVGLVADRLLFAGPAGAAIDWRALFGHLVIAGIIAMLALRYFYVQQQLRLREQAELQARIQALQSRIRPHFLFNSMNSIASLIATDPVTAEAVVEDLAELFRASLTEVGQQVPLAEELELCRRYLRIEQLRLGERLKVEWSLEPVPAQELIPLLTLQPLLENAVYHGIQPLPAGGTITIRVAFPPGRVEIEITNPVADVEPAGAAMPGNRIALGNVRDRLLALHGSLAYLETRQRDGIFVTRVCYPARARLRAPTAEGS